MPRQVAYVAPSFSASSWHRIRALVPPALASRVEEGDIAIEKTFFRGVSSPEVYLTRHTFSALLETLIAHSEYASVVYDPRVPGNLCAGLQYS